MRKNLPPIWLAALRVQCAVNEAVRRFARLPRYDLGADLRVEARHVVRCVRRAWLQRGQQLQRAKELSDAIDELKDAMQAAKQGDAFRSFREFEALARLINDLGQQCGGWLKGLHSTGQNGQGLSPAQRAPILSSRPAFGEASP